MARTLLPFVALWQPERRNSHGRHAFGDVVFYLFWPDNAVRMGHES